MTDFTDYGVWREVSGSHEYYTQSHEEYSPEDILKICQDLIASAENDGLQGCYIVFTSTMEPYEDYLGYPTISVSGYRKHTNDELAEMKECDEIRKIADQLDTTIPYAKAVYDLRKEGKL